MGTPHRWGASSLIGPIHFIATVFNRRAPGMTQHRLPPLDWEGKRAPVFRAAGARSLRRLLPHARPGHPEHAAVHHRHLLPAAGSRIAGASARLFLRLMARTLTHGARAA